MDLTTYQVMEVSVMEAFKAIEATCTAIAVVVAALGLVIVIVSAVEELKKGNGRI